MRKLIGRLMVVLAFGSASTYAAQVLIVFDDSGSMATVAEGQRPPYDPTETTYTYDGTNTHPSDRVYWSTNGSPPAADSANYFLTSSNRCATSVPPLQDIGFFQTRAARWFPGGDDQFCTITGGIETCFLIPGQSAGWKALSSGVKNPPHLDCEADVIEGDPGNGSVADGYPQNTSTDGQEYGPNPDGSLDWGSSAYTFYSAHYMDWYHDASLRGGDRTRLEIAQEVVDSIVAANTSIDFGLALFNENSGDGVSDDYDGGRIVQRLIPTMTGTDRTNLTALVNSTTAGGLTPLCETTMEVYRYLSEDAVVYGNEKHPTLDTIAKDSAAESPAGTYDSPVADCAYTYVILMTDGRPSLDMDANAAIESLTGKTCQDYPSDEAGEPDLKNCLPEIAEYMANTDLDGDSSNGDQFGITYTIGFTMDQQILSDTAQKGKGQYFSAENADELTAAFQEILDTLPSQSCESSIDIEKLTNGNQADGASDSDVPRVAQGETITWTYLVTNTGATNISDAEIIVTDSQPDIAPVLDTDSDIGGDLLLSLGETWTYTASAQALDLENTPAGITVVPGCNDGRNTYQNTGRVEIIGSDVSDEDLSHYCNFGNTDIDIRKQDEGPDTQIITSGSDATFEIQVTNSGAIDLQDVVVSDAQVSSCDNTIGYLGAGETMTYTCEAAAVTSGFTSEACVSGTSDEGVSVQDCDESTVEVEVVIDIKPSRKSSTNVINLKKDRNFQVAIVGSDTVDALLVDPTTVTFGPGEANPVGNQVKDYNRDGFSDLILTFTLADTGIACGDTEATLSGELYSGGAIQGSDSFTVKRCP